MTLRLHATATAQASMPLARGVRGKRSAEEWPDQADGTEAAESGYAIRRDAQRFKTAPMTQILASQAVN
jgi:hypothetical protein